MNNIKGLIFDLDGTLCNTMPDLKTSMNEMLRNSGLPERTDEQLYAAINCGAYEFVRRSVPEKYHYDEPFVKARLAEYNACYNKHYIEKTVPYDGMIDTIEVLKSKGFKLGVLSNKPDFQCKKIVYHIFGENAFDFVYGQKDFPTKPDPSSALFIAKQMKLDTSEIAFIGDSNVDMETGKNAGMYQIGVSWGYRPEALLIETGAKIVVHNPTELINSLT